MQLSHMFPPTCLLGSPCCCSHNRQGRLLQLVYMLTQCAASMWQCHRDLTQPHAKCTALPPVVQPGQCLLAGAWLGSTPLQQARGRPIGG